MRFKSYKSVLEFLYEQLPMYQRQGKTAFKKDLTNIKKLIKGLGNPHLDFKSIHIAGTNGKGSTAHLMASAFVEKGIRVGLYTSPHYLDFRERIKIGSQLMSKRFVVDFVNKHMHLIESIKPSFFEITVAMAFDYFSKEKVDIAIIETGLGGRLDSTNVITPLLSIITNISLDHQSMLGNTLVKIAREKAGIIKKGIPVLVGEKQKEVEKVFIQKAKRLGSPIYFAREIVKKHIDEEENPFFKRNKLTAWAALKLLGQNERRFKLRRSDFESGVKHLTKNVYYIGRWQMISKSPRIIVDSAHNQEGINIALKRISEMRFKRLHIVLGFVNDKEVKLLLKYFPRNAKYYFAKANIPRGLEANDLKKKAEEVGLKGKSYISVRKALASARASYGKGDLILVMGSIFVVGEVLQVN